MDSRIVDAVKLGYDVIRPSAIEDDRALILRQDNEDRVTIFRNGMVGMWGICLAEGWEDEGKYTALRKLRDEALGVVGY